MAIGRGAAATVDEHASGDEGAAAARWYVVRMHDRRTGAHAMRIVSAADERAALLQVAYDGKKFTELRITEVLETSEARQ